MPKKITKTLEYELYQALDELSAEDQQLIVKAREACAGSYSPYSHFRVGAALLLEDGQIVIGSNQENAAYPDGLCAERVAFFAAGAVHPGKGIIKVAIAAHRAGNPSFVAASPCGSCRQVMLEYESKQEQAIALITHWDEDQFIKSPSIANLLPFSFSKNSLVPKE
jgi:cytidine deaminase